MTNDIIREFEQVLRNNTWMKTDSKQALLLKLRNMKAFIAYEDEHFDLKAFDSRLKDYIQEEDFEGKYFLEIKQKFDRLKTEEMFHCLSECEANAKDMRSLRDLGDAHTLPSRNLIGTLS
ncbi:hypothetical protein OESDEN_04230 [Oesophagostomum dentatum]|uniref:Peptidase M13 N-terminal domain-containing protein n=1 Tax=Oesophagostomum dentatum TaxID=61180 RepID=A0A0B1TI91_OESDE|nr:hypothetical protein OESDEN_04230 [Oesophagostomum dentatum]